MAWAKPVLLNCQAQATFYASGSFRSQRDGNVAFFTGDGLGDAAEHGHEIGRHICGHESCIFHLLDRVRKSRQALTAVAKRMHRAPMHPRKQAEYTAVRAVPKAEAPNGPISRSVGPDPLRALPGAPQVDLGFL